MKTGNLSVLILSSLIAFSTCFNFKAETCQEAIADLEDQFRKGNMSEIADFIISSGRNVDDFGQYNRCIRRQDARYALVTLKLRPPAPPLPVYLGVCGPAVCHGADYEALFLKNEQKIEDTIGQMVGMNLTGMIRMEVDTPQDFEITYDSWRVFTIIIIILVLTVAAVASFLPKRKSKDTLKPEKEAKESSLITFVKCFDIRDNFYRWIPEKEREGDDLAVFNGLRVISMIWVVWGHGYLIPIPTAGNIFDFPDFVTSRFLAYACGLELSVDVFFFMGGFFFAFVFVKKMANQKFTFGVYFYTLFHRILRIIPSYFVAMLLYWKILPLFGLGPVWPSYVKDSDARCLDGWWRDMLFVNNFGDNPECMLQGWYLAVDMQIFLASPFFILAYLTNKTISKAVIIVAILASIVYSTLTAIDQKWGPLPLVSNGDNYPELYYQKPWARAPVYLIGLVAGILYLEHKNSKNEESRIVSFYKESKLCQLLFSIAGFVLMVWTIVCVAPAITDPKAFSQMQSALYISCSKPLFIIGLWIFIMPCLMGGGRVLRNALGNPFFGALAKLSFSVYLLHWIVLDWKAYDLHTAYFYNHREIFIDTISTCLVVMPLAIVVHLFVEIPFGNIEQKFFAQRRTKAK